MPRCPTCHRRLGYAATCPIDGGSTPGRVAVPKVDPPRVLGFEVGELLGLGGSSRVWAARRESDNTAAVLKLANTASDYLIRRFHREASVLEALPPGNAPTLLEVGTLEDGVPFVAMERLPGTTLAEYLEALPEPEAPDAVIAIAASILRNLEALHGQGLSHYDLKPGNILLVQDHPEVDTRLIDFGLSSPHQRELSDESTIQAIAGTSEYMAPERLGNGPTDYRADIYGFGVVLYELMTLRVPFVGQRALIERGHVALRPPRPSTFTPVPAELESIALAMLAKVPGRRPSLESVAARLRHSIGAPSAELQSSGGTARAVPRTKRSSRQPVVILVVDVEGVDAVSEIRRRGGVVARQRGAQHVCVFSAATCEEPIGAAINAAEALANQGLFAALHIAELRVRAPPDEGTIRVYGMEVERPEDWLPEGRRKRVLFSEELAGAVDIGLEAAAENPGFWALSVRRTLESSPVGPMLGRAAEIEVARSGALECLTTRSPQLLTVVGSSGLGKSRLATELGSMAGLEEFRVVHYRARGGADNLRGLLSALGAAELAFIDERDAGRDIGELLVAAARIEPTALIIDDAHRLSEHLCDAIEYATLDTIGAPLWVVALASPRLEARRREWGRRANRHRRIELSALDEATAMELAAELLKPADLPPAAFLKRLAKWAGGNPFYLVELVRALKRQGLVRERESTGSFFVATADFEKLPAIPAGQWLATRLLEGMPAELASLARLCAVLGSDFSRHELAWIQEAADTSPTAASPIDVDVGLLELERLGVLRRERRRWLFADEAVVDAIARTLPEDDTRLVRQAAMAFWREPAASGDEQAVLRFASHAAASGARQLAAETYIELGDAARIDHRSVDADQYYTAALELTEDESALARALGGRGEVRYRMQRPAEALDDLTEACRLAVVLGDEHQLAQWLLAQATALDWSDRFPESAERVEEATRIADRLGDKGLAARCLVATGRTRWRQERIEETIELLDQGAAATAALGDYEYQVIALLLLPLALVFADRRDEAEARFSEVISLCESAGDRFHLCAAYGNRMFLWRNAPHLAVEDLRRANQLAREVGQAGAERVTTHNLAEILFWSGDDAESLALARRGFELQRRLFPTPVADDPLLLARIHAGRREWSHVAEQLTWIEEHVDLGSLAPSDQVVIRMLTLLVDTAERSSDAQLEWDELLERAREVLAAEEFLEVLYMRSRAAASHGAREQFEHTYSEAQQRLEGCAVWQPRFASLRASAALIQ